MLTKRSLNVVLQARTQDFSWGWDVGMSSEGANF